MRGAGRGASVVSYASICRIGTPQLHCTDRAAFISCPVSERLLVWILAAEKLVLLSSGKMAFLEVIHIYVALDQTQTK